MKSKEFLDKVNSLNLNVDLSKSVFKGLKKKIEYICHKHGKVSQKAFKILLRTGCPLCDIEQSKKKRKGSYSRKKGHNYELKISKELNGLNLGYNIVTSRLESKRKDDNKIDLVDLNNLLPFYPQIKCTKVTPNYFEIIKECDYKDKPFVLFWNKQINKEGNINMTSEGELVMIDKKYFYELLKK